MREWRQGVRKLLLLLYTAALLISLGCFLWNASAPIRVHSAPKCYPSKGDGFTLAPLPTLPPDSILNTGDAAGHRPRAVGADCGIPGGTRRVRVSGGLAECQGHRGKAAASNSRCAGGRKCRGKQLTGTGTVHNNTKLHHQGDETHVPHPISRRRRCFG